MDRPSLPTTKSPRRDLSLQGPRPTPLRVHTDSHKIRKPPTVPPPWKAAPQPPPPQHRPPPVIIYTVSPKVIHTNPNDFMTLVQRLTGPSPGPFTHDIAGPVTPAARFASMEKTIMTPKLKRMSQSTDMGMVGDMIDVPIDVDTEVERTGFFPGILSPGPGSLQPIPANFFSPPSVDPNHQSFFSDLSPVLQGNRNFLENNFMPSPSYFLSPNTQYLDLFNNF